MTDTKINSRGYTHHQFQNALMNDHRLDLSNMPINLKNLILEQSTAKLMQYHPQKVSTRSEYNYTNLDTKRLLEMKKKRIQVRMANKVGVQ
jgi:hypothetical protein